MRVADYIAQTLANHGIRHVFLITGGGAMHLNDAIGRCKDLSHVCFHHEQACTIAAESYYRLTNRLAAVNVTSGPGGTNALTGVLGAWQDSLGMIVISGQVKRETMVRSTSLPLRQLGDQEADIVKMVSPITKYAELVWDPQSIRYHLERALYLATHGRPGPVWLDIPLDVQAALIDPETLSGYDSREDAFSYDTDVPIACQEILERLSKAERPVIYASSGIRLSGAYPDFLRLIERLGVPVVTAWNSHDLIWNEHPCYAGRPGSLGDRPGNFAVQNSDFVLSLGCRLSLRQVSYNWESFARKAYLVVVDIDKAELQKPTIKPDMALHADVAEVLQQLLEQPYQANPAHASWQEWCRERVRKYPVVMPEYYQSSEVNPYVFAKTLFERLSEGEIVVTGNGTACVVTFQAAELKKGQRLYTNSGCASMGYDLPAAIGAAIASGKRVVCVAGDGSLQMNLQELQTIVGYRLPIKIIVLNNRGYHSIRQTQQTYFTDNPIGFDSENGVTLPDLRKLAFAYGLPYHSCASHVDLAKVIPETLMGDGPQLCEVFIDISQPFLPRVSSKRLPDGRMVSAPLEDMFPFLDRDEFLENLWIPPYENQVSTMRR